VKFSTDHSTFPFDNNLLFLHLIKTSGKLIGSLSSSEEEVQAALLVRSLICIASTYLDKVRDGESLSLQTNAGLQRKGEKPSEYAHRGAVSNSWVNAELLSSAKRLRLLQVEERIFLSLAGLRSTVDCNAAAAQIAEERSDSMISFTTSSTVNTVTLKGKSGSGSGSTVHDGGGGGVQTEGDAADGGKVSQASALTPEIRRLCALLGVSPFLFAHTVMKRLIAKGASSLAMDVARNLGSEDSASCPSASPTAHESCTISSVTDGNLSGEDLAVLLEAAVTLCTLAAKPIQVGGRAGKGTATGGKTPLPSLESMTQPFVVIRDLLRGVASICPAEHLGKSLDILNGSELVLAVYQRVEGAVEEPILSRPSNSDISAPSPASHGEFKINETVFTRDGILMTPGSVLGLVLRYSAAEVKRRMTATTAAAATKTPSEGQDEIASDLEELVCTLQRSENHMLAVRVLLSSWHLSDAKAQLLRSSLLSLSRKVLSYREIDTSLAVACLVMLPYDAMVRELKGAVPSIQSDFSRLRTVASVGEELARLWDQEGLLAIFQGNFSF
jgi:hypothetical protein